MTTTATAPQLPAAITGKFNIALTQSKFQDLQNKADKLVFNEDHLPEIAEFLKNLRAVRTAIKNAHTAGKEEALRVGQQWDAAKRSFEAMVTAIEEKPNQEYVKLCQQVENRRIQQQQEQERIQKIKDGIETNALKFASDIANCETSEGLASIERIINLEKSRKEKYQEFLPDAVTRFNELNSILAQQKITVRELEANKLAQEKAKKENDDAALLLLQQQEEEQKAKIDEGRVVVQEAAINQSVNAAPVETATEVFPAVKARRSSWTWEILDIKETAKKMPDWTNITPNEEKIDDFLKAKKAEGITGEEFTVAGIKFFLKKTY